MTTRHSPLYELKAQADHIASVIKRAERGEHITDRFAEKISEARKRETFKVGVVMDDKVFTIEMTWARIRETDEAGLSAYMLGLMQEARVR